MIGQDRSYVKDLKLLVFQLLDGADFIDEKNGKILYKKNVAGKEEEFEIDIYRFIFLNCKTFLQQRGDEYKINLYNDEGLLIHQIANIMHKHVDKATKILLEGLEKEVGK